MSFISTKPLYHRKNTLNTITNSVFAPSTSTTVMVLPRGAVVNGNQGPVDSITVHEGHDFVAGQKLIIGTDDSVVYTVDTGVTITSIPLTSTPQVTVTDGDILVNLGNDTATSSTPDYDTSTIPIFSTYDSATASTISKVVSNGTTGSYEYWSTEKYVWELILVDGDADTIVQDIELDSIQDVIDLREITTTPDEPTAADRIRMYMKGDKLVYQFYDGSTIRYYLIDLTANADQNLSYSSTAP